MNERHEQTFEMKVHRIFKLANGRTVIAGAIDDGEEAILIPGKCQLLTHGRAVAEIDVEPEIIFHQDGVSDVQSLHALGTSDPLNISPDEVASGEFILTGKTRMRGHRHLIGIDSPPNHFVPDRMTLGPRLPDGWDGDAWTNPDESLFFLRAWNKERERYAIGTGNSYEESRTALLTEIRNGGRPVVVSFREVAK